MDDYPSDQHQMPPSTIKLKSSDGEIFEVEVKVAQLSLHIKEMLDELGVEENDVISIPQNAPKIHGDILRKIILWANHHKDDPAAAENYDDMEVKPMDDISCWDAKFLQVDQNALFQMIRAANYLNIQGLLDVTCKKLANIIKGKNLVQMRRRFKIRNDFSPNEEDQVHEEKSWCYTNSRFTFERFNRITPMLLQASCTTLCSIRTDAVFAVSLISYGICLKNVQTLEMYINFNHLERVQPEILRIVKNFDLTRLFPNVNKVQVFHTFDDLELSADHLTTIINQTQAVLREPAPDCTANVKELQLELDWNLSDAAALYFAEMFSNINRLTVVEASEQEMPFELIWKHWVDLEEFEVITWQVYTKYWKS